MARFSVTASAVRPVMRALRDAAEYLDGRTDFYYLSAGSRTSDGIGYVSTADWTATTSPTTCMRATCSQHLAL